MRPLKQKKRKLAIREIHLLFESTTLVSIGIDVTKDRNMLHSIEREDWLEAARQRYAQ